MPIPHEACDIPICNPDGRLVTYGDPEFVAGLLASGRASFGKGHRHRQVLLKEPVLLGQRVSDDQLPRRAGSLSDLLRDQRYVYRTSVGTPGEGLFAFTLKDLPGVGIRFSGEKVRPTEHPKVAEAATLFYQVLHEVTVTP